MKEKLERMKGWLRENFWSIFYAVFGVAVFVFFVLLIDFTNQQMMRVIGRLSTQIGEVKTSTADSLKSVAESIAAQNTKTAEYDKKFDRIENWTEEITDGLGERLAAAEESAALTTATVEKIIDDRFNNLIGRLEAQRAGQANQPGVTTSGNGLIDALSSNAEAQKKLVEEAVKLDALREAQCRMMLSPTMSDKDKDFHCKKGTATSVAKKKAASSKKASSIPANISISSISGGGKLGEFRRDSVDQIWVAPNSRAEQAGRDFIITPPPAREDEPPPPSDDGDNGFDVEVIPAPPAE